MELSCPLGTTRGVPQEKFLQKPYTKYFIDQACSVKMAGYWPRSFFCVVMGLDYVSAHNLACVADETKPRYSPSANQRPKACSVPRVLQGFSIIGSNWLLHMAVLSCTVIGRVDLVEPWLRSR